MSRQWCIRDLFVDHKTGKLRETAVWSNIGKAAMTWAFCLTVYRGASTEWLWVTFGGIVVAHESVSRILNQKQQTLDKEPKP